VSERPRLEVIRGGARPRPARGPALELLALGTGLVLSAVLLARLPSWRAELGTFQALYAVAFVFYAIAVWRSTRDAPAIAPSVVLIVALAARVAMLPVSPSLSGDVHRSVWEGRALVAGFDPYRLSPQSPQLSSLRDDAIYPRVEHPELASAYPPLALAGFALVARISATVWAMKTWILLHDLALVWLLVYWVRGRGLDATAAIAYAWSPLVLVEYAGSGHHDPTAMVWLIAALMFAERRPTFSAVALAIATLTRLLPIVALPFLWRSWTPRARVVASVLIAAGLGLYVAETRGPDSGVQAFARVWTNNELLFHSLARWLGDPLRACLVAAALVGVLILSLWWRGVPHPLATRAALRGTLIASPVAPPWSFGWALLLEPLGRSPGWILLSLTCVLAYGVLAPPPQGGAFDLPLSWRWLEYGLPLSVAATFAVLRRRDRSSGRRRVR
jgi:hypothetical protein